MRIRIISVGRAKNNHLRALADDYLNRVRRFTRCEFIEVRESASAIEKAIINEEGERIIAAIGNSEAGNTIVLLDVEGEQWSSPELAKRFEMWQMTNIKTLTFVIGGHLGASEEVRRRANYLWSFGRITLPHEMARVVVAEQIYRAFTIMRGLPYQK